MSQEARDMPGGATGLFLFLLGSAAVFLSGVILVLSGFGSAGFGSAGWVIPLWGGVALVLAVISRNERASLVMTASKIWLVIGILGLAMMIFGTNVRLG
jgi:hypothetical protein